MGQEVDARARPVLPPNLYLAELSNAGVTGPERLLGRPPPEEEHQRLAAVGRLDLERLGPDAIQKRRTRLAPEAAELEAAVVIGRNVARECLRAATASGSG